MADFWTEIILKHPSLEEYIKEDDRPILKHVKSIYVDMAEKPSVVTVKIEFTPNDYFTNTMLEYVLRFEEGDEEQIEGIIGTAIDWKKGQNVTRKRVRKSQKHRETGKTRTVFARKIKESFFNIFASREPPVCTNSKCKLHES